MSTVHERTALVDQIAAMTPTEAVRPASEMIVTPRGTTYVFDLPGVLPANLHVACHEGQLLIWGIRISASKNKSVFAAEAPITANLDPQRIAKTYENGVLTVYLPKRRDSIKRS